MALTDIHPAPRSAARFVAVLVAAFFVAVPFGLAFLIVRDDDFTWRLIAVSAAFEIGAVLLGLGVARWYGGGARRLRVAGFVILLLASLWTVSLAFLLVPAALLAAPSLRIRSHETDNANTSSSLEPRGQAST